MLPLSPLWPSFRPPFTHMHDVRSQCVQALKQQERTCFYRHYKQQWTSNGLRCSSDSTFYSDSKQKVFVHHGCTCMYIMYISVQYVFSYVTQSSLTKHFELFSFLGQTTFSCFCLSFSWNNADVFRSVRYCIIKRDIPDHDFWIWAHLSKPRWPGCFKFAFNLNSLIVLHTHCPWTLNRLQKKKKTFIKLRLFHLVMTCLKHKSCWILSGRFLERENCAHH